MKTGKKPGQRQRMEILIQARPMTSLMEKEILLAVGAIRAGRDRWVRPLFDTGRAISMDRGRTIAFRAINQNGDLMWLVSSPGEDMQYHSTCHDPLDALDEASAAFARRRPARTETAQISALTRDLMRFRKRLTVTIADAGAAGLSPLAIDCFCNRLRIGRRGQIPGWLAAMLTRFEPDIGLVLYAAAKRQKIAA